MKILPVLLGVAAAGALALASYQIGCAIYALGCFRKFNRLVKAVVKRIDVYDPDAAADNVVNLACLAFIAALIVAVIL